MLSSLGLQRPSLLGASRFTSHSWTCSLEGTGKMSMIMFHMTCKGPQCFVRAAKAPEPGDLGLFKNLSDLIKPFLALSLARGELREAQPAQSLRSPSHRYLSSLWLHHRTQHS